MELKGNSGLSAAWRLICRIKQTPNTYWDDNGLSKALERGVLGKTVPKISTAEIKHIMYSAKITKPGSLPHPFPPPPSRDSGSSALAWFRGRRRSEMGWCRGSRDRGQFSQLTASEMYWCRGSRGQVAGQPVDGSGLGWRHPEAKAASLPIFVYPSVPSIPAK